MDMTGNPVETLLDQFWQNKRRDSEVCIFATQLVRGVSENMAELDALIDRYSLNWEIDRMPVIDRNILRLGMYELIYRDDIPPKVAINEAVELANKFSTPDSKKFVNGILDRVMAQNRHGFHQSLP